MQPPKSAHPGWKRPGYSGTRIKVCGLTTLSNAEAVLDAGVDAIGLNFWAGSKRRCEAGDAKRIVAACKTRNVRCIGVFVNASIAEIENVRQSTGVTWVQLHGDEDDTFVRGVGMNVWKAFALRNPEDLDAVYACSASEVLLDAYVPGAPGGTGALGNWKLAAEATKRVRVWLAGGLRAENVVDAIRAVRPFGVDVASGVEERPGIKDVGLVRAFVQAVRSVRV